MNPEEFLMKKLSALISFVCLFGVLTVMLTACDDTSGYAFTTGPVTAEGPALSWSPDGKWIVFPSSKSAGGVPELYALNVADALAGAGRDKWVHLSAGFGDVIEPANLNISTYMNLTWSPDGQRIAFTAGHIVYAFNTECLTTSAVCMNSLRVMIDGASAWTTLEWSPDSTLLLAEGTNAGPLVKTDQGQMADKFVIFMHVVVADGSKETLLTRQTPPRQAPDWQHYSSFSPAWSPDGERIVYASGKARASDLYILTLAGEEVVRLTQTPDTEEYSPSWSPDGKAIMYAVDAEGQYDIYVQKLDGSEPTCVTCNVRPAWQYSPLLWMKWSPDGTRIAYAIIGKPRLLQRAIPYYLYLIAPDGSNQIPVIEKGYPIQPFWSPDGARLAFAFRPRPVWESIESDIFLVNADGSNLTNLTR
jgi:Tol biopolymer transport system component